MSDIGDELEKLAALRDKGVLTAAEFAEQKAKLLGESVAPVPPPTSAAPAPTPAEAAQPVVPPHPVRPAPVAATPRFEAKASGFSPKMLGIGVVAVVGAVAAVSAMSGGAHHSSPSSSSAYADSAVASTPAGVDASGSEARSAEQAAEAPTSRDGAPSQEDVERTLIAAQAGKPENYRFISVQVSAPQPITPVQQMSYEAPPGGTWYLVRLTYTWNTSGDWNNPAAYIHDVVGSYAMFHNAMGEWSVSGDPQPGDKDVLRGGYANQ